MKKAVFSLYYVKYMPGISIKNASRNKRELSAAHEFGFRTVVFSGDKPGSVRTPEFIDRQVWEGTEALDETIPKWKFWFRAWRNRFILFYRTMRLPIGVWSCHDLSALSVAYRVTRFRIRKPILIYDSHEFEMGRNVRRTRRRSSGRNASISTGAPSPSSSTTASPTRSKGSTSSSSARSWCAARRKTGRSTRASAPTGGRRFWTDSADRGVRFLSW